MRDVPGQQFRFPEKLTSPPARRVPRAAARAPPGPGPLPAGSGAPEGRRLSSGAQDARPWRPLRRAGRPASPAAPPATAPGRPARGPVAPACRAAAAPRRAFPRCPQHTLPSAMSGRPCCSLARSAPRRRGGAEAAGLARVPGGGRKEGGGRAGGSLPSPHTFEARVSEPSRPPWPRRPGRALAGMHTATGPRASEKPGRAAAEGGTPWSRGALAGAGAEAAEPGRGLPAEPRLVRTRVNPWDRGRAAGRGSMTSAGGTGTRQSRGTRGSVCPACPGPVDAPPSERTPDGAPECLARAASGLVSRVMKPGPPSCGGPVWALSSAWQRSACVGRRRGPHSAGAQGRPARCWDDRRHRRGLRANVCKQQENLGKRSSLKGESRSRSIRTAGAVVTRGQEPRERRGFQKGPEKGPRSQNSRGGACEGGDVGAAEGEHLGSRTAAREPGVCILETRAAGSGLEDDGGALAEGDGWVRKGKRLAQGDGVQRGQAGDYLPGCWSCPGSNPPSLSAVV